MKMTNNKFKPVVVWIDTVVVIWGVVWGITELVLLEISIDELLSIGVKAAGMI